MCQRYALPEQLDVEREFHPTRGWWKFAAKFNVAAAAYVPAIRLHEGQSEGVMMRWGLIPSWAEGKPTDRPTVCVHSNRVERSGISIRSSWLNSQRCILPVAGFYVWQLTPENYRQPFFVRLTDRSVFGVAAIWGSLGQRRRRCNRELFDCLRRGQRPHGRYHQHGRGNAGDIAAQGLPNLAAGNAGCGQGCLATLPAELDGGVPCQPTDQFDDS